MIIQPANIEIVSQQIAALTSDRKVVEQQLQRLISALEVGTVIEAQLDTRQIRGVETTVLLIDDIPIAIKEEQIKQIDSRSDQVLKLKVQSLSRQRIELKIIPSPGSRPADVIPVAENINAAEVPAKPNQTSLLELINQLNPDNTAKQTNPAQTQWDKQVQQPSTPDANPIVQGSQHLQGEHREAQVQKLTSSPDNPLATGLSANNIKNESTQAAITSTGRQTVSQQNSNAAEQTPGKAPVIQSNETAKLTIKTDITTTVSARTEQAATPAQQVQTTVNFQGKSQADSGIRIDTPGGESTIQITQQPLLPASGTEQKITDSSTAVLPSSVPFNLTKQDGAETTVTIKQPQLSAYKQEAIAGNVIEQDISGSYQKSVQAELGLNQGEASQAQPDTNKQASITSDNRYALPELKLNISLPDAQQFPILAQAVQQAAIQLQSSPTGMTDQLNRLLNQLERLNTVQSTNKRELRSESGQVLNKATEDLKRGLKDLQRYIPEAKQLTNGPKLTKAFRQSGIFFEQKQQVNQQQQSSHAKPSIHHDLKANLQRLISASLYHIAKISTTYQSASQTTGTGTTTTAQQATGAIATKLTPKTDLITRVKQRLQGVSNQAVSADLPRQIERLLRQILTQSNEAMNRTKLNQLGNLRPDTAPPQWFFEIPVMNQQRVEPVQIFIRREDEQQKPGQEKTWSLVLQFNIQQLGRIRAILKWYNESVNIQFIAEHQPTKELINQELDFIRAIVKEHQVSLDELTVQQQALKDIHYQFSEVTNSG
jgi:hypothetical protein